ncbi:hypothetical protein B0H16DRAFT_1500426 [Mycena metata]|uniref:Uncharacterized protein n=1 Tax=Mycena metata TaxID=1033252 RepID=A0AAD7DJG7_9AGAR|nr:hypothetical protein B0H16DRAFT_1654414 [Mycena metata]KAJ7778900.1 hypothetical protein B0H16DRAFT_1500426 [Mycena metata]
MTTGRVGTSSCGIASSFWNSHRAVPSFFHSNIPIGPNEHRYSFTQYTAGGLFRWIEHGFQSEEAYFESLSPEERARERAEAKARWSVGVGLFSTLDELRAM